MPQLLRLLALLFVLCFPSQFLAADIATPSEKVSIDFLYINANAGEAAGGHTALRLGDAVFHYQFFPDSTFLLVREPWDSFRFLYNDLHNRSIAIAALPLDLSVATQIRHHFTELLADQEQFFNDLEKLRHEEQFVKKLFSGRPEVSVESLGFFSQIRESVFAADLVEYLETTLGVGFLQHSYGEAEKELQQSIVAMNRGSRPGDTFQETLALREALRILLENRALHEDALIQKMEEEQPLNSAEKILLQEIGDSLARSLAELLRSKRPDRGAVILLQTARFRAVQHSLKVGHLLTLDPFFEGVREVSLTHEEIGVGRLTALQEGLLKKSTIRRDLFFKEERHPEIAYSLMETSRARAWELLRVSDRQRRVRILTRATLPTRPGNLTLESLHPDRASVEGNLLSLKAELGILRKRSEELYGYNLFTRNCATELIRSLNATFPDSESGREALGGWMEPDSSLVFIPFLFYEQSLNVFSLQDEQFIQARRLRNLAALYEQESDLLVWLRESNTLSSTLYEPRSKDTPFLFFTDDSLLLRPLLGLMNVAYGVLHGVAGFTMLPFDGGDSFNQAFRGIFYSLPELTFGNIRKGSYSIAESEDRL